MNEKLIKTDPICGRIVDTDSRYFVEECHQKILFCSSNCQERYLSLAPKDIDPVCGMRVPSSSPYVLEENNQKLWFCSVDCRAIYQSRKKNDMQCH